MILIGLGANLPSPTHGAPRRTLAAALDALDDGALHGGPTRVVARSRWYRSAPVPASDQPWFINGVAALETTLDPAALLAHLHAIEAQFGRVRSIANAPRVVDIDLLDYHGRIEDGALVLPHPRLHQRAFVLVPLAEVAPDWCHPVDGRPVSALIAALPGGQVAEAIE